jgi:hypothetical protein
MTTTTNPVCGEKEHVFFWQDFASGRLWLERAWVAEMSWWSHLHITGHSHSQLSIIPSPPDFALLTSMAMAIGLQLLLSPSTYYTTMPPAAAASPCRRCRRLLSTPAWNHRSGPTSTVILFITNFIQVKLVWLAYFLQLYTLFFRGSTSFKC